MPNLSEIINVMKFIIKKTRGQEALDPTIPARKFKEINLI